MGVVEIRFVLKGSNRGCSANVEKNNPNPRGMLGARVGQPVTASGCGTVVET